MIALKEISNKEFKILAGEKIPKDILKKLDVNRLKELKIIGEDNHKIQKEDKTDKKESK